MTFLSTPSARRATGSLAFFQAGDVDFYPRPPRGGRRLTRILSSDFDYFYPRPPRGGRLGSMISVLSFMFVFLSTPSARRATSPSCAWPDTPGNFYPRPPRGGRQAYDRLERDALLISIHALREEGDSKNGEKHLRFCFIIKRSAQIWKSFSKNIRKKSRDLHRMP